MRLAAAALVLSLGACQIAAPAAGGAAAAWLGLAYRGEQAADLAITIDERVGCLIEAKDQQHGQAVSKLASELCAALLLERRGGVP